jgi:hypothetical protein
VSGDASSCTSDAGQLDAQEERYRAAQGPSTSSTGIGCGEPLVAPLLGAPLLGAGPLGVGLLGAGLEGVDGASCVVVVVVVV